MNAVIDRLRSLTVRDVMSRSVVWVTQQQHMADVATLLLKHELSTAPVVDDHGRCVGMLSATDFLKRDSNAAEWGNAAHRPRLHLQGGGCRVVPVDQDRRDARVRGPAEAAAVGSAGAGALGGRARRGLRREVWRFGRGEGTET